MAQDLTPKYSAEDRWKAVIDHGAGLLVINAGPGTGKTYSLVQKIGSLLDAGIEPDSIYYLTFVNSIVDAFKRDIQKPVVEGGLGKDPDELGIRISTLHSLAFKIVKTYASSLDLSTHLEAFDLSANTGSVLGAIFINDLHANARQSGHVSSKNELKKELGEIQAHWQESGGVPTPINAVDPDVTKLCERYQAMPWDRLVPTANDAIERYGLPKWIQEAKHFLIDEYQDFNPAEHKLIELISEPSDSVVVVGDVDQSIYSGRSASPHGLLALLDRDDVSTVNFVWCRRCPRLVIGAANKMLEIIDPANHASRALQPNKKEDGTCVAYELKSCKAEIECIAEIIKDQDKEFWGDIIIVMAGRAGMEYYRDKLQDRGVQCEIPRQSSDIEEITRAYLRLAVLGEQPLIERLLVSSLPALERRWADDVLPLVTNGQSVSDALIQARDRAGARWRKDVRTAHDQFHAEKAQFTSREAKPVSAVLKTKGIDIPESIIESMLSDEEEGTAGERVEKVMKKLAEDPDEKTSNVVQLLTMHSSKGLSKGLVIIPAAEDKWIPGSSKEAALEEKHRLFYVALTRAEEAVVITVPATRAKGDPLNYQPPDTTPGRSRYLRQVGLMS